MPEINPKPIYGLDYLTDNDWKLLKNKYKNLKPNKIILPKKNVYYIYEFSTNIIDIDNITKIKTA